MLLSTPVSLFFTLLDLVLNLLWSSHFPKVNFRSRRDFVNGPRAHWRDSFQESFVILTLLWFMWISECAAKSKRDAKKSGDVSVPLGGIYRT